MKALTLFAALLCFSAIATAQKPAVTDATFHVSGVCGMCKTRIEKALSIKEVKYAKWDKSAKMVKVAFLSASMTLDSLQHRVALAGHDTEKYRAPDAVYADLPGCCLYRDKISAH